MLSMLNSLFYNSLAFTTDYSQLYVAYHEHVQSLKKRDQFYKDPIYHHFD